MKRPYKGLLTALFLSYFITHFFPLASTAKDADLGVQSYQSTNYEVAKQYFISAVDHDPQNPTLHYHLANTYTKLGQPSDAIIEYQKAYSLSTNPELCNYCKSAIANLINTVTIDQHPTMPPHDKQLVTSVSAIKGQADQADSHIIQNAQTEADSTLKGTSLRNKAVQEDTKNQIRDIQNSYSYKNAFMSQLGANMTQELESEAANKMASIKTMGEAQATAQMALGMDRSRVLDQSAMNLEKSLAETKNNSGMILSPKGTNLYIRNYIMAEPLYDANRNKQSSNMDLQFQGKSINDKSQ